MRVGHLSLALILAVPLLVRAQEPVDEPETAWGEATSWLRPRRNPYRSTVSDIVERGRRSPFRPPPIQDPAVEDNDLEQDLSGPAARRFMLTVERDLNQLQAALRESRWGDVVVVGRRLLERLETTRLDSEHQVRRNEMMAEARHLIDEAADSLEEEGMKRLEADRDAAREGFARQDWPSVREAQLRIERFVDGWEFKDPANSRRADTWKGQVDDLVRRSLLWEEFAELPLKIGFLVISEDGASTALVNGRPLKEGDSLDEDLRIKDISNDRILFIYKGEEIPWTLESSR